MGNVRVAGTPNVALAARRDPVVQVRAARDEGNCNFKISGVKTPDKNSAVLSCLKARPTIQRIFWNASYSVNWVILEKCRARVWISGRLSVRKIGRASCRERV